MKQKLFIAGLALAAGLVLNVSKTFSVKGASLSEIVSLNSAQACTISSGAPANGKCAMGGNCFTNPYGPVDCTF